MMDFKFGETKGAGSRDGATATVELGSRPEMGREHVSGRASANQTYAHSRDLTDSLSQRTCPAPKPDLTEPDQQANTIESALASALQFVLMSHCYDKPIEMADLKLVGRIFNL
ncbi:hypothetical protein SAMN06265222_110183 [Neorhodopirellula lusitana]|uniref:Uncharacterized protein n=1 Tax=Neorhodopirellula lusitana TaxID=445327 RepID=A0ABY1QD71_9BACT|nr:hypothetical protein [Neorhodopirellula lusitana]SMP67447.1 hypothetical protein SAMN06265222_110183 [Neorhodopirellula lusitana]